MTDEDKRRIDDMLADTKHMLRGECTNRLLAHIAVLLEDCRFFLQDLHEMERQKRLGG